MNAGNDYRAEARERWGHTDAFREYEERAGGRDPQSVHNGLNEVFAAFAACRKQGKSPASDAAGALVGRLQTYITEHYYTCTREILVGLGQMYVQDERFARSIDSHGEGTAAFVAEAIAIRCNA